MTNATDTTLTPVRSLEEIALHTGTDKNATGHNYASIYAELFASYRHAPARVLEIGVWEGASLRMWSEYFTHPEARIVGLDIDVSRVRISDINDSRVTLAEGDASDGARLAEIVSDMGAPLHIVIDDGSHLIQQQRASFTHLRQYLAPGALYIVEDLHTHFWERANPSDAFQWLTDLASDIVGRGTERSTRTDATPNGDLRSLTFYQSLAVFQRKDF